MKLEDWRNEIDSIDAEIVRLVNQRATVAKKIGVLKATAGLPVADADRETEVLRGVCGRSSGALTDESLVRIFRQILCESRLIQTKTVGEMAENKTEIHR